MSLSNNEKEELYQSVIPIARCARAEFIGESEPINDSFKIIEQLGFLLLRFPTLESNSLSGFYIKKGSVNCIYINSKHTLGRQFTSVWHEYYHYYTEDGQGLSYIEQEKFDRSEYKADCFAGCVLMPENIIKTYIADKNIDINNMSYSELILMQNFFRVSTTALIFRLTQVFPESKEVLRKYYSITMNNPKAIEQLSKLFFENNGDIRLIQPTNEVYIPTSFYDDLESNLINKKISKEKAYELLSIINQLSDGFL